ncbi:hypothetical protein S40293_11481 [Stachybotrys chartarum IBT 40293]|nr:hypothetical protein S40293_11481 [Stachybotrys chartarum IBT 40293]
MDIHYAQEDQASRNNQSVFYVTRAYAGVHRDYTENGAPRYKEYIKGLRTGVLWLGEAEQEPRDSASWVQDYSGYGQLKPDGLAMAKIETRMKNSLSVTLSVPRRARPIENDLVGNAIPRKQGTANQEKEPASPVDLLQLFLRTKDNALVLLLTIVYTREEFVRRFRRRPSTTTAQSRPIRGDFGPEPVKELPLLGAAAAYNSNMGAVNIGDQLRVTEGLDYRNRRGIWLAIASSLR